AAYADVVAQVEQLVKFKALFANCVFLYVDLQALSVLLQVSKASLAHQADGHDASGKAHVYARGFELLGSFAAVLRQNLGHGVSEIELVGIRWLAQRLNLLQLLP